MATSRRFETYWNATIVHITNALLRTHAMDSWTALTTSVGLVSSASIPPYQSIMNACKGELLQDPQRLKTCQSLSVVMRGGDTYLTELIGIALAMKTWPKDSAQYYDAFRARRLADYRMEADGKLLLHRSVLHRLFWTYPRQHLRILSTTRTEQAAALAEMVNYGLNPNSPAAWVDKRR